MFTNVNNATMNRRERQHDNIREEVKAVARKHMAAQGTAAISLRAIARDMELSAPALYRYFPSRDDLITALIVDSFNSQGEAMRVAVEQAGPDALAQLAAFMLAYRDWALTHTVEFELVYGNPIPDYHAPADITSPAAQNAMGVGVQAIDNAIRCGALVPTMTIDDIPPEVRPTIEAQSASYTPPVLPVALYLAMVSWGQGHGLIMLELFGHLQPTLGDPAAFYRQQVGELIKHLGGRVDTA